MEVHAAHVSVGFQHAAELLRLVVKSDLHTLRGTDIYCFLCFPRSITIDLTVISWWYFYTAKDIQKKNIKDIIFISLNKYAINY